MFRDVLGMSKQFWTAAVFLLGHVANFLEQRHINVCLNIILGTGVTVPIPDEYIWSAVLLRVGDIRR